MPDPATLTLAELATQPEMWRRAAATTDAELARLPQPGEPVLVLGCGTSYYVGEAYARRRIAAAWARPAPRSRASSTTSRTTRWSWSSRAPAPPATWCARSRSSAAPTG